MNQSAEINRLLDLMPASGRMLTRLASQPNQPTAIAAAVPLPWKDVRPITINFDLWSQIPQPQRDMLLLHTVCWLLQIRWFKFDLYPSLLAAGLAGTGIELLRTEAAGIIVMAGLTALAATQVWRKSRATEALMAADEAAIKVAQRRGYSEAEAARHLAEAIVTLGQLENHPQPTVGELVRSQNLRAFFVRSEAEGSTAATKHNNE